jgi:hypothetical protein
MLPLMLEEALSSDDCSSLDELLDDSSGVSQATSTPKHKTIASNKDSSFFIKSTPFLILL